jgi:acyl-coenzyme A synthetase/AMP-(fatty) acid ligase
VNISFLLVLLGAGLSEKNIADFVAQKVAPHKQLRGGVVIASSIPKSASGKILRRELRSNI